MKQKFDSLEVEVELRLRRQKEEYDKLFQDMQRRLSELEGERRMSEAESQEVVSRQIQSVEKEVEEVRRVCEERSSEALRKVEQAVRECPKRSDFDKLAVEVEQLKRGEQEIRTRVPQTTASISPPAGMSSAREFVYDSSKPLEGVIAHLRRQCGGNVHDKGIVNVTASSVWADSFQPKNVVDLGTDSCYQSADEKYTWICYDFKERRVIPKSYSVTSCSDAPGGRHLKSWVIEVSNNGSSWTTIDSRNNNNLNAKYVTATFKISHVLSESFRFFRIKQTGETHAPWEGRFIKPFYWVGISSLEIFGTLFEK